MCLAQGVPAALLPDFQDQDQVHYGNAGGNPDLDPETGDTLTIGFVWSSRSAHPLLARMQLAIDWYRIEVDDAIQKGKIAKGALVVFVGSGVGYNQAATAFRF